MKGSRDKEPRLQRVQRLNIGGVGGEKGLGTNGTRTQGRSVGGARIHKPRGVHEGEGLGYKANGVSRRGEHSRTRTK